MTSLVSIADLMASPREPALINPLESLIGYQLRRASASLMAELGQALASIVLKPAEASVLVLIGANPGITQSDLGRILNIQRANMAPLTAMLDKRGLIERRRVDGRSHGLALTTTGADLARAALAAMERHEERINSAIPEPIRGPVSAMLPELWRDPPA